MTMITLDIRDNQELKRYEADYDGHTAFITYIKAKGKVYLTHTEVPKGLEGRGVGSALVKGVLAHLKENGHKLFPLCPFVAAYIRRHREWEEILAEGVHV